MKRAAFIALAAAICLAPTTSYAWQHHGGGGGGFGGHGGGGFGGHMGGFGGHMGGFGGHMGGFSHGGGIGHMGGMGHGGGIIHHGGGFGGIGSGGIIHHGGGIGSGGIIHHGGGIGSGGIIHHGGGMSGSFSPGSHSGIGQGGIHHSGIQQGGIHHSQQQGFGFSRIARSHGGALNHAGNVGNGAVQHLHQGNIGGANLGAHHGGAGQGFSNGSMVGHHVVNHPGAHGGQLNQGINGGAGGLTGHHHNGAGIPLNHGFANPNHNSLPGIAGHHHNVQRPHQMSVQSRQHSLSNTFQTAHHMNNHHYVNTGQLGYWPTWYGSYYGRHHGWLHGHNYGLFWSPYSSIGWWWNQYPYMWSFGLTPWSLYRTGYAFGYYPYYNPYCYMGPGISYYYNYTRPLVNVTTTDTTDSQLGMQAFDKARQQFKDGAYLDAYNSTSEALKYLPNDVEVHQFRSVVLFALGHYTESAAGLYAILGVSPAWDWETLRDLYPSVDVFTGQLRQLEDYRDAHPSETAPRFVLAYLYGVMRYGDDAALQLERILKLNPDDKLAAQLLKQLNPDAQVPPQPQIEHPPAVKESSVTTKMLVGTHHATREDGGKYEMTLKEDGTFAWNYTKGDTKSNVTGVYTLKDDGVLALQMDDGAVMLAQIVPTGEGKFSFYMLGESEGQPPLKFGP